MIHTKLCEIIWPHVTELIFHSSIYGLNVGISLGLGKQWALGMITIFSLWIIGIPLAWIFGIHYNKGFVGIWQTLSIPYCIQNFILILSYIFEDWNAISEKIELTHFENTKKLHEKKIMIKPLG